MRLYITILFTPSNIFFADEKRMLKLKILEQNFEQEKNRKILNETTHFINKNGSSPSHVFCLFSMAREIFNIIFS